ncbi:uncharacterized protein LOC127373148 [Dicentrarchus labrax]|uniref:uncharacterized protein LOC127373148 n=1 Tax=Dicentrarchus labrax TaxID=13489 RepID=UPI0021F67825|nr:uncharacterized protein LOC127373148 [Dicentrarchus labrax]XP_051273256.1 uncharacterized protein LOC127373148 [Dicentrarchus labrax]
MVMTCSFPGCKSTTKLLSFPTDRVRALRWLQILGMAEDSRTSKLKVCALHFSPECFTNYTQAQMGFAVRLHLTDDALPNPPEGRPSKVLKDVGCQTEVRTVDAFCGAEPCVNHVRCQTVQIGKHNVSTQANRKPFKRSKAVQARAPHRSVECDTSTLEFSLDFVNDTPVKRFRYDPCSYSDDDPSNYNNETESAVAADSPESYQEPLEYEPGESSVKSESEEESVETEIVTVKVEPEEYEEPLS